MKLYLLFALVFSTALFSAGPSDYETLIRRVHRGLPFHGNILIKKGEKVLFKKSYGKAHREWDVDHTWDSRFMIASLSKQFTAYAILLLEEEGKLKLQDPVSKYIKLPRNSETKKEDWDKITLYQLLTHSSGIIRDVPQTENMSPSDYNFVGTIITHTLMGKNIFFREPGKFHYSNLAYLLLAEVIEKVSYSHYETFLKRNILMPLKMYNSGEFHRRKMISKMSSGYYYNDLNRVNKRCCRDASTFKGSHSLYSSVDDLEKWQNELISPKVLNSKVIEKMKTKQIVVDENSSYGFGLFIDRKNGQNLIWHNGHEYGFVTLLSYIKELDLTIIYLSNSHGHEAFNARPNSVELQDKVLELFTKEE